MYWGLPERGELSLKNVGKVKGRRKIHSKTGHEDPERE